MKINITTKLPVELQNRIPAGSFIFKDGKLIPLSEVKTEAKNDNKNIKEINSEIKDGTSK